MNWVQRWRRNALVAAIALVVCAAVYLNWSYDQQAQAGKTLGQSTMVGGQSQDPLLSQETDASAGDTSTSAPAQETAPQAALPEKPARQALPKKEPQQALPKKEEKQALPEKEKQHALPQNPAKRHGCLSTSIIRDAKSGRSPLYIHPQREDPDVILLMYRKSVESD